MIACDSVRRALIGGKPCYASSPSDLAPALIGVDAETTVQNSSGVRTIQIQDLYDPNGRTVLHSDDVLTEIHIPNQSHHTVGTYLKYSQRKAIDFPIIGVATVVTVNLKNSICERARIVLGGISPRPLRMSKAEEKIKGKRVENRTVQEVVEVAFEGIRPYGLAGLFLRI